MLNILCFLVAVFSSTRLCCLHHRLCYRIDWMSNKVSRENKAFGRSSCGLMDGARENTSMYYRPKTFRNKNILWTFIIPENCMIAKVIFSGFGLPRLVYKTTFNFNVLCSFFSNCIFLVQTF